ncbi:MAG: hypothetical protein ACE5HJ_03235 [Thermoplasmata archaeon]
MTPRDNAQEGRNISVAAARSQLMKGLRSLPRADKLLLGAFFTLAVSALALGGLFALILALEEANFIHLTPLPTFQFLTLHASVIFYY